MPVNKDRDIVEMIPREEASSISIVGQAKSLCAADKYLMSLRSKNSRRTMKAGLNKVAEVLGYSSYRNVPFSDMCSTDIDILFELMMTTHKMNPKTVNLYFSAMKGVFKQCWTSGDMNYEDYLKILTVKELKGSRVKRDKCIVEKCSVTSLLDGCNKENTNIGLRDAAMFSVLAGCGLRREEVAGLNLSDYDKESRKLYITGKGDKERISRIPNSTVEAIENWIEVRGTKEGAMFCRVHRSGVVSNSLANLTGQTVYDILHKRCEQYSIGLIHPHAIRHYYATQLLRSGVDIVTVRDMMGHQSIATTQTYIDESEIEQLKATEHMEI
jgi:site-specific recombinase XerD